MKQLEECTGIMSWVGKENNMKNTQIDYLYRDACNYKNWNTVVVKGEINKEQIEIIIDCLDGREFFIPSQVGLSESRFDKWTEDDHCWFELDEGDFKLTDHDADVNMTVEELVSNFMKMKNKWDDTIFEEEYV